MSRLQMEIEALRPEEELLLLSARTRLHTEHTERIEALLHGGLDWVYLAEIALHHRAYPLLHRCLRAIHPDRADRNWAQFLEEWAGITARRNLYLTGQLLRILELFEEYEILAIPYKGPAVAALAYGNVALRPFEDLDIAMRQRDVRRASEILERENYRPYFDRTAVPLDASGPIPGQYYFLRKGDNCIVELHTEFTLRYFPVPLDIEMLGKRLIRIPVGGREIRTLSVEDLLSVLSVHGSKHFWDGLIWMCDIAELIQGVWGVDWGKAEENARRTGCLRMFHLALFLAENLLDAPLPEEVSARLRKDSAVRWLAAQVGERLFSNGHTPPCSAQRFFFRLRMRGSIWDGARYCWRLATSPTEADWSRVHLPPQFSGLYRVLRPVHLLQDYGLGSLAKRAPDLAPFEPTPPAVIERILALGEVGPGDLLYDLGCGDGRIVVTAAKRFGIRAVGVDVDPKRITEAKALARQEGVEKQVAFIRQDAKTVHLSGATVVILYLTLQGNLRLQKRLRQQLRPGSRIVSRDFSMGAWPAEKLEVMELPEGGHTALLLWRINSVSTLSSSERGAGHAQGRDDAAADVTAQPGGTVGQDKE